MFHKFGGDKILDDTAKFLENYVRIVRLIGDSFPDTGMEILLHNLANSAKALYHIKNLVSTELQSTGGLALLQSQSLRRDLADYYTTVAQESRIGFDLNLQHLFDRLTAGILTTSELSKVEEFAGQGKLQDVSASRALEIAQEFATRHEAVRLLPNIAQYHVFNQKITESYRRQALVIIEEIESLLEENET